jgi:hypothetical protein
MTTTNMTTEQMELGFNGIRLAGQAKGRQGRIARASWWFAQMREIVNRAVESAEPRPEQMWMAGTTRQVKV